MECPATTERFVPTEIAVREGGAFRAPREFALPRRSATSQQIDASAEWPMEELAKRRLTARVADASSGSWTLTEINTAILA
jgi:hypothetical protein